jgi:hypothetical protein
MGGLKLQNVRLTGPLAELDPPVLHPARAEMASKRIEQMGMRRRDQYCTTYLPTME